MSKQIFKEHPSNELLFDFLEKINVLKTEKYFLYNKNSFKKAKYLGVLEPFILNCDNFYHISKKKYLQGDITQKRLTTIIRQICNNNNIKYISKIQYDKSTYDILYYIYYNP